MYKWKIGRQCKIDNKYYYKKIRLFKIYKLDCYLIKYTKGCAVGYHKDIVEGHNHYRLNIQLKGENSLFILTDEKYLEPKSFYTFFRADENHSFGPTFTKGLILSFGIAFKKYY